MKNKKCNFFANTAIARIYIQLGNGCNLRCKYCYHNADNQEYQGTKEINDDIFTFIEDCAAHQKEPIEIRFFGGEPMLYFKEIKYVIEHISHIDNLMLSIITNGSLINEENARYFNEHKVRVTVSWDGHEMSKKYRGYDAFEANKDNLFILNDIHISATIVELTNLHALINDIESIGKEYSAIHNKALEMTFTPVEDLGTQSKYIDKNEYNKIYKEFRWLADKIKEAILKPMNKRTFMDITLKSILQDEIMGAKDTNYNSLSIMNGSDNPSTFSMDLKGNFYLLHRFPDSSKFSEKIGSIYDNYFTYLYNFMHRDDFENQTKFNNCKECKVRGMCRGFHPILTKESEKNICKNRKAIYLPLIEIAEELCRKKWKDLISK